MIDPLDLMALDRPPFVLRMGLNALDPADWIWPDHDLVADLAEKARLIARERDAVIRLAPEGDAAAAEMLALLADHLPHRFPRLWRREGSRLVALAEDRTWRLDPPELPPLELAARLVQEDLLLLQPDAAGRWQLVQAAVCFPSRWRLADKIGQDLAAIHQPVPGLEAAIGGILGRWFAQARVERPVWRANWSLVDDPALHLAAGHGRGTPDPDLTADTVAGRVTLRLERQTLRRLARSGAILFTIRILRRRLADLARRPDRAAALAVALRHELTFDPALSLYKSLPVLAAPVLDWLDRVAATPAPPQF